MSSSFSDDCPSLNDLTTARVVSVTNLDRLPLVDEDADEVMTPDPITNGRTLADRYHLNADGSIESAESSCANGADTPPAEQLCQCKPRI